QGQRFFRLDRLETRIYSSGSRLPGISCENELQCVVAERAAKRGGTPKLNRGPGHFARIVAQKEIAPVVRCDAFGTLARADHGAGRRETLEDLQAGAAAEGDRQGHDARRL